uniref:CCHC-type domain-containing protein n=1 Tax=Fagus sylvatica TaxID=28930 RepID=A0A2N9FPE6_FAGSY
MDFSTSTFWVQVHGLPVLWQQKDYLTSIGQQAGHVLDVDLARNYPHQWRRFVRIKIEVNIIIPLKSGIFLTRPGLKDLWIGLKYEKLLELCYKCGIIGHPEKECTMGITMLSNQYGIKLPAFGEWIRTENFREPPEVYGRSKRSDFMPEIPKVSLVNINEGSVPDNFQVISGLKVATTSTVARVTGEGSVDSGQVRQTSIADSFRPREVSLLAKLLALSLQKERSALKTHMMQDSHLDHQVVADPNTLVECAVSSAQHAGVIASEDKQRDLDPTPKTQSVARPNLTQSQFASLIIQDIDQPKAKYHHQLKSKRFKKKTIAGSVKLSSMEEKSDGYSSEAASSTNSLPNSEEGFEKPPPTQ